MKKFEYKEVIRYEVTSLEELNNYIQDGWRLCFVRGIDSLLCIFKREVTETEK